MGWVIRKGMRVIDEFGGTLQGAIDGINQTFTTSLPFDADTLEIYIRGLRKMLGPEWVDGADVVDSRTIRTREALQPGDDLAVCYSVAGAATFGGAPYVPAPAIVAEADEVLTPRIVVQSSLPPPQIAVTA